MDRIKAAQVFVAIVERGSLSAAAEALDMSRAMVTRYLAELERWANARLLHRSTRRLGLTAAGESALTHCQQLLELAEQIALVADAEASEPHGMLRIACGQSLAQAAVARAVSTYLRRYPRTAIDLQVDSRPVNLIEERIDLAIRITNQLDPNLIARRLARCPSVVCASPGYLAAHGTPRHAEELSAHNCLTYSYFGKSLWRFSHRQEWLEIPVSGNLSANESSVLLSAAVEGAGIVLQPLHSAAALISSGELVALLPDYQPEMLDIYAIYSSREHLPATLRTLLDFLIDWFATDQHWIRLHQGFPG